MGVLGFRERNVEEEEGEKERRKKGRWHFYGELPECDILITRLRHKTFNDFTVLGFCVSGIGTGSLYRYKPIISV